MCGAVELEILHSARSKADAERIRDEMRGFDWLSTPDEAWDRALDVQTRLIAVGNWKALSVSDLVIAATAAVPPTDLRRPFSGPSRPEIS